MSRPFSRYLHPFDRPYRPAHEPEVEQAIFAYWAEQGTEPEPHVLNQERAPNFRQQNKAKPGHAADRGDRKQGRASLQ